MAAPIQLAGLTPTEAAAQYGVDANWLQTHGSESLGEDGRFVDGVTLAWTESGFSLGGTTKLPGPAPKPGSGASNPPSSHKHPSQHDDMSRTDAYHALREVESDDSQARESFKLVESAVDSGVTSWSEGVAVFVQLRRAENDSDHARENFRMVAESARRSESYGPRDFAEAINRALEVFGGANHTTSAQTLFRKVSDAYAGLGASPTHLVDLFAGFQREENDAEHANQNFSLVLETARSTGQVVRHVARAFSLVLEAEGGANSTSAAQATFAAVAKAMAKGMPAVDVAKVYATLRPPFEAAATNVFGYMVAEAESLDHLTELVASAAALRKAENDDDHGVQNFKLVVRAAEKSGEPLADVTEGFNRLLQTEGGANSTSKAQASFKLIYDL